MAEHRHTWVMGVPLFLDGTKGQAACIIEDCDAVLNGEELEKWLSVLEAIRHSSRKVFENGSKLSWKVLEASVTQLLDFILDDQSGTDKS